VLRRLSPPVLLAALVALSGCGDCGGKPSAAAEAGAEAAATARTPTPAEIRAKGNHLVGSSSAYLLQHAHNPVDWHPWGEEALNLAKELDRPIFLSIGYASCHWCHVMEREVFDQDDVAELMNRRFVAIKVDREERPDLDASYMDAVLALSGDGGWPLNAFLTPGLKPFFGATYVPKEKFLKVAADAADRFARERSAIETKAAEVARQVALSAADPADRGRVRPQELELLAARAATTADPRWGGWGSRTKFPSAPKLRFLLHAYRKWGDAELGKTLRRTLDAMASGGVYDHVGGGFHRYAVDAAWLLPHFEKMLYVNALLAGVYLEASSVFEEPRYLELARDVLDAMVRDMTTPEGAFAASLDADSGGKEGSYYTFSATQVRAAVPGPDGEKLAAMLGATDAGPVDGASVLNRRAEKFDAALFARHRAALLAKRNERPRPALDAKVVTAWNALAIAALARASTATGEARYREAATRAMRFLRAKHVAADGKLARASTGGATAGAGTLEDYGALAEASLELFLATGETKHLADALATLAEARKRLETPEGAFFSAEAADAPLGRRVEVSDRESPSGEALVLDAYARAAALTGQPALDAATERLLDAAGAEARGQGLGASAWLDAALLRNGPFYEVVIAGNDAATSPLAAAARKLGAPWFVLLTLPAAGADAATLALAPAAEGKSSKDGRPLAFVCLRGACKLPAREPAEMLGQLRAGWVK
jgi:hypothetical protein